MRAADDFVFIRARMEQLQRERRGWREPKRQPARSVTIIGVSDPKEVEEMKSRIMEQNRIWMAQRR